MAEFDYQFENLPSKNTAYNKDRISELLAFTKLQKQFFAGKICLDAGCGNGRYTWAMRQLGAIVTSIDISSKAVEQCKTINLDSHVRDIMTLKPNPLFDFVLSWGVLHHLADCRAAFTKVASQVKPKGVLHIMVYHDDTQQQYVKLRIRWQTLNLEERLALCREIIRNKGGDVHGWYDALNPKYNWSYYPFEVEQWFREEGFEKIALTQRKMINMQGVKN